MKKSIFGFWKGLSLPVRILFGLAVGVVLGLTLPGWRWIGLLGTLFVGALKAIAPVLVALLVTSSIAKAGSGVGPRFRRVIILYLVSTALAAFVAVLGSFLFPVTITLTDAASDTAPGGLSDVFTIFLTNIVCNPVEALVKANYIGILFWAIIFGLALKSLHIPATVKVISDLADMVSTAVKWVIRCAPLGIMGLVFKSVSESGLGIFVEYGQLLLLLVGCMLISLLLVNPLLAFAFLRRNPYPLLLQCLKDSGVNAFFTRSSAANIPVNLELCSKLGLDEEFYSVSIPLGSTINMNGAAITITVLSLAVANTVGIEVGFGAALLLCLVSTLSACGASGVAGGSLLLVPLACSFFGIPQDIAMQAVAVGFIIGVVQDSMETALNSTGDVFFTAVADISSCK